MIEFANISTSVEHSEQRYMCTITLSFFLLKYSLFHVLDLRKLNLSVTLKTRKVITPPFVIILAGYSKTPIDRAGGGLAYRGGSEAGSRLRRIRLTLPSEGVIAWGRVGTTLFVTANPGAFSGLGSIFWCAGPIRLAPPLCRISFGHNKLSSLDTRVNY